MKITRNIYILALLLIAMSCNSSNTTDETSQEQEHNHDHAHEDHNSVHLTQQQFDMLGLETGKLQLKEIDHAITVNGVLAVPPQKQAVVTSEIGATVNSIKVIDGDKVKAGQTLAVISHPEIIKMQADYINNLHQMDYLKSEYERLKDLHSDKVVSGKEFEAAKSAYLAMEGQVKADEASLKMMRINIEKLKQNEIVNQITITSPIDGYVQNVNVNLGQYVDPQTELFHIINNEHIHADFTVYESDFHAVNIGDTILFSITSNPAKEYAATIYAVGKSFDNETKAVHIHADINNKAGLLLPGMYVEGHIVVPNSKTTALPEDAIVAEMDKHYVFTANQNEGEWQFEMIEVRLGNSYNGFTEVTVLDQAHTKDTYALNNAYYLISELQKGEAEHSH